QPERAAQILVEKGISPNYDDNLRNTRELPYGWWREYDPEDALRFFALRLRDAGMFNMSPQDLISRATDWRFFNAIKAEPHVQAAAQFVCPVPQQTAGQV